MVDINEVRRWADEGAEQNRRMIENFRESRAEAKAIADAAKFSLAQAQEAVGSIVAEIERFERELCPDEEARMVVIGGPAGTMMFPTQVGPLGSDRILFLGTDEEDCRVTIMQHVSQLNLMLKAVKVAPETARRSPIGFHTQAGDQ